MLREDFLQQFAFDAVDAYCPPLKAYWILKVILSFSDAAIAALNRGVSLRQILEMPIRDTIAGIKTTPHEEAIAFMQSYTGKLA